MRVCSERKRHVIVMGDFNDFDGQVMDVSDNAPNSRVLQILSTVRVGTRVVCVPCFLKAVFHLRSWVWSVLRVMVHCPKKNDSRGQISRR